MIVSIVPLYLSQIDIHGIATVANIRKKLLFKNYSSIKANERSVVLCRSENINIIACFFSRIYKYYNLNPIALTFENCFGRQGCFFLLKNLFMVHDIRQKQADEHNSQSNHPFVTCFHLFRF